MSKDWLNSLVLKKKIRTKAPIIEVDGTSQSRRVSGYLSSTKEVRAYESVICYIQKGLGTYDNIVFTVIKEILDSQFSAGRENYLFHQFSFGWEDQKLHHSKKPIHIISRGQKKKIIEKLCELAGSDTNNVSSIIPGLYPPVGLYSRKSKVSSKDLLVFICKDRSVQISEVPKVTFNRVKHRVLWIFINDNMPEWEFGTFKPETSES